MPSVTISVSYTHLDVYKRQVLTYMARMLQEAKSKGLSLRREAFQDSGRRVTLYKGVKAVSYTHLDVYKRQPRKR